MTRLNKTQQNIVDTTVRTALNGGAMCCDPTVIASPEEALFDPLVYGDAAQPVGEGGRQAAWFVAFNGVQAVLRHYRRGGLMAKLGRSDYLWLGEARTRSFAEFRLMHAMHASGLPVPRPLAAAWWRTGLLSYRAAILIERIAAARPLASVLDESVESAVATAIVRTHRAGVWHADLNAHNILLDPSGQAWLIDFDRGRGGGISDCARQANLTRLRRSLEKLAGARGVAVWQRINDVYQMMWLRD